jgi:hypothetical protein
MIYGEFKKQVETIENRSCFMCRHLNNDFSYNGYSSYCKKCEELTTTYLTVTAENTCGYFERKLSPKEYIEKYNIIGLVKKQDKNCRTCKNGVTSEIYCGKWHGKCKIAQINNAFTDDTDEMIICDLYELKTEGTA